MILLSRPSQISDNDIEVEEERHFEMSDGRAHDKWGPCHQGMAGGGTACNMEGSREYIEYAVADSRQGVVFQLGGLGEVLKTPYCKNKHSKRPRNKQINK
jgi:hypothetical protein